MNRVFALLTLLSLTAAAQYTGELDKYATAYTAYIDNGFNPIDASCVLVLRADMGVSATGGEVDTWADQSGNGNDFTATTTTRPTLTSGYLDFDSDDYMLNAAGNLDPGTAAFTWEAYIECADYSGTQYLIGSRESSSIRYNLQSNTGSGFTFYGQNGTVMISAQTTNNVVTNGQKVHIVFSTDRSTATFYVNGSAVSFSAAPTVTAGNLSTSASIGLGARNIPLFFITGKVWFVRISNTARSASEVSAMYAWLQSQY